MKEISIAVCFDENYALNGAMTLYSAAKNIEKNVKIKAYIIDGGIIEETKKRFNKILRKNLDIIWLEPDLSLFDNLPLSSWTTKVAHSRLLLPYIINDDIKKIIYLDSDILVIGNLLCLWEIPLNNYFLAAFQDITYTNVNKKVNSQVLIDAGMDGLSPYFNSGFLIINIYLWKKNDILRKYIEILKNIGNKFTHCNQDAMNIIFNNKWLKIRKEMQYGHKKIEKNIVLIHYTGKIPGFPGCSHPKEDLFYRYVYSSNWFSKSEYYLWRFKLLIIKDKYFLLQKIKLFFKNKIKGTKVEKYIVRYYKFMKKLGLLLNNVY